MFFTESMKKSVDMKIFIVAILSAAGLGCMATKVAVKRHNQPYLDELGGNQAAFEELVRAIHAETPYLVLITSGYRTGEQQARLHAKNGKNAKPGRSLHEHQRAIDINLISWRGLIRKGDSKETWRATKVPEVAKKLGFRWGGDFKNYHDPVHFDLKR